MKKRDLYNMSEFNDYSEPEDNQPQYMDEEAEVDPELYDEYSRANYPEYNEEDYEEEYIPVQRERQPAQRGGGGYFEPEYYMSDPDFQRYLLKNGLISYDDDSDSDYSDSSSDSEQNIRKRKTKQNKTKSKTQTKKKTTKKKGKK